MAVSLMDAGTTAKRNGKLLRAPKHSQLAATAGKKNAGMAYLASQTKKTRMAPRGAS
jgi:hypothetical protein